MNKEKLILLGGGGNCKSCIDVIEQQNIFQIVGILDIKEKIGQRVLDYEVIGTDDDLKVLIKKYHNYFITIGQIRTVEPRRSLFSILKQLQVNIPSIISPRAHISKHSLVSKGTIVMHNAVINAGANIGENCIINTGAIIEHDAIISDHCHISTGVIINGGVKVGESSFVGSGSITKEYIDIKSGSFIKAQSLVKN